MKKILALTLLLLSFTVSAFAATLATNTPSNSGTSIFGGVDSTSAGAATNPLVRFSTGVEGLVNFTATGTPATSIGYAIVTKHTSGSKYFGTANDSTNIFWKQDIKGDMTNTLAGSKPDNSNFTSALGWTSY